MPVPVIVHVDVWRPLVRNPPSEEKERRELENACICNFIEIGPGLLALNRGMEEIAELALRWLGVVET